MLVLNLLVAAYALVMLLRHAPRAVLFLAPGAVRLTGDPMQAPRASGQVAGGEALEPLGFRRLGLRRERGPLGGLDLELDSWAHADGTCADVYAAGGRSVAVAFLTTMADGFQVGTSNFRRAAAANVHGRVGGVAGASLDVALSAHRRIVEPLVAAHGAPRPVEDLGARIELARRYYSGIGAAEMRRPALMSLMNATIALMLFAWSVVLALRALGYIH